MEAIIAMIMKFFGEIFSDVIKDQLNSLGETNETILEKGTIEMDTDIDDVFDRFGDL